MILWLFNGIKSGICEESPGRPPCAPREFQFSPSIVREFLDLADGMYVVFRVIINNIFSPSVNYNLLRHLLVCNKKADILENLIINHETRPQCFLYLDRAVFVCCLIQRKFSIYLSGHGSPSRARFYSKFTKTHYAEDCRRYREYVASSRSNFQAAG